jgi:hypothetical protein
MRKIDSNSIKLAIILILLTACQKNDSVPIDKATSEYYILNINHDNPVTGLTFLDVDSYQQTTEYTCGPSAVLTLLSYYGRTGDELTIAGEMGTSTLTGTTPEQMAVWLDNHAFGASWHEEGTIEMLRENLKNNIPTLVEWSDWGGHWVLVIGYDTRNTDDPMDDVIIFADPYDRHDDNVDGFTWFNAQRFYYMWYDALLFERVMKNVYIQATPYKPD